MSITDAGPVLVEGNNIPGEAVAQMPSGRPLGATAYADALIRSLRRTFRV